MHNITIINNLSVNPFAKNINEPVEFEIKPKPIHHHNHNNYNNTGNRVVNFLVE